MPKFQHTYMTDKVSCYQLCSGSYIFEYSDSIILYFQSNGFNRNEDKVREMSDSLYSFRFEYGMTSKYINQAKKEERFPKEISLLINVLPELPDTFELSGLNSKGLWWKDIYLHGISVGYDNVSSEKKEIFDKCLKGIRMKIKEKKRKEKK